MFSVWSTKKLSAIAMKSTSHVRQRTERDQCHISRIGPSCVADELLGRMAVVQHGHLKAAISQSILAVKISRVGRRLDVRGCCPNPWPPRWIQLLNQGLHVPSGQLGPYLAGGRCDGDHIRLLRDECERQTNGIVNARVKIENDFAGHSGGRLSKGYRLSG